MSHPEFIIRASEESDIPQIQSIYSHHVLTGTASFEITPPDIAEMLSRRATIVAKGLPYLVAVKGDEVLGYAYATVYRPRPAYRFTVEDSVYIREGIHGKGIGKALLQAVIDHCTACGYRQMLAVIGDSSAPSVALHQSLGFELAGTFKAFGFKFGAWRDTAMMQRHLGEGSSTLVTDDTQTG
ncbi:MAG: N-acetyltransferase family protein [Sheuella sp.]|nr:N-acetyltransferase family protein [Sheuella sp.]